MPAGKALKKTNGDDAPFLLKPALNGPNRQAETLAG